MSSRPNEIKHKTDLEDVIGRYTELYKIIYKIEKRVKAADKEYKQTETEVLSSKKFSSETSIPPPDSNKVLEIAHKLLE
ncbi:MAG TPA: hypothetical protein VHE99_06170 [Gammaproteobacteria bacterium]|nr:hypothetical protein [Gammaproteobacteria bacterium]